MKVTSMTKSVAVDPSTDDASRRVSSPIHTLFCTSTVTPSGLRLGGAFVVPAAP